MSVERLDIMENSFKTRQGKGFQSVIWFLASSNSYKNEPSGHFYRGILAPDLKYSRQDQKIERNHLIRLQKTDPTFSIHIASNR